MGLSNIPFIDEEDRVYSDDKDNDNDAAGKPGHDGQHCPAVGGSGLAHGGGEQDSGLQLTFFIIGQSSATGSSSSAWSWSYLSCIT